MEKANTRVDYGHRALLKGLINLDNQKRKPAHIQIEEVKGKILSDLVYIGFNVWNPNIAEDYKTRYDKHINEPARKLEKELDTANRIIDSIKWKELIPFYEENKQLGLEQANLRWVQKIKPVDKLVKYKVIQINEKNPDEQNTGPY